MQKTILSSALHTTVITAETKAISTATILTVKKQLKESFLHRLFFGLQQQHIKNPVQKELPWNDPDAFISYE